MAQPLTAASESILQHGAASTAAEKPRQELRVFAELLNSKADLQRVTATIHDLVAISFTEVCYPVNHRTAWEERRRGQILLKWFGILRRDLGFSLSQTLETLPYALKAELQGKAFEPPKPGRLHRVG